MQEFFIYVNNQYEESTKQMHFNIVHMYILTFMWTEVNILEIICEENVSTKQVDKFSYKIYIYVIYFKLKLLLHYCIECYKFQYDSLIYCLLNFYYCYYLCFFAIYNLVI